MTNEEKAIDYARTECCNSCTDSCKKKNKCKMFCNVRNAVLYGLAEGREENEKIENDIEDYQEYMRYEEEVLAEEMERQRIANYDFERGDVKY